MGFLFFAINKKNGERIVGYNYKKRKKKMLKK